jgi:predicted dehydrogenase
MEKTSRSPSRRSLLHGAASGAAVAGAFQIIRPELVRGAGDEKLKAGLIGTGGRGSQAVVDLLTGNPNVEVVAMADLFEDKLQRSFENMRRDKRFPAVENRVKVDGEHQFTGFDAYKKLIASDVDIVMLCTPPGWRPIHFEAAVNAKKHVFAEKPVATDPVGCRRFMAAAKKSEELKLSVVSGAQNHANTQRIETVKRIQEGEIGDIVAAYARYHSGPVFHARERDPKWSDMEWQHRNWYSYIWLCGDQLVEQHFHNIDAVNWVMGGHPVKVWAQGSAVWRKREPVFGNIYDHMASDYVYANGVHLSSHCRQYPKEAMIRSVGEEVVGSKGRSNLTDRGAPAAVNPYEQEHIHLVKSILGTGPYRNEAMAVAESTMTCIMGREAAYSGLEITWDMIMNSKLDLMPKNFNFQGSYKEAPLPVPSQYKFI